MKIPPQIHSMRLALTIALFAAYGTACTPSPPRARATTARGAESAKQSAPLEWVKVSPAPTMTTLELPAEIKLVSGATQALTPPAEGRISEWLIEPGAKLAPGTPIANILTDELSELGAEIREHTTLLRSRQAIVEGLEEQLALGLVSTQQVREARAAMTETSARLETLKAKVRTRERLGFGRAGAGKWRWDSTVSGTATAIDCATGAPISPTQPCLTVIDSRQISLYASIPEHAINRLEKISEATWTDHITHSAHPVELLRRDPELQTPSHTLGTHWVIARGSGASLSTSPPGASGVLVLAVAPPTGCFGVPRLAVTTIDNKPHVFLARGAERTPTPVEVHRAGERDEVLVVCGDELTADSEVVARGAFMLKSKLLLGEE